MRANWLIPVALIRSFHLAAALGVCYNAGMSENMNRLQDLRHQVQDMLVRL